MEIQNNLENKAKFFAVYWGQTVLNSDRYGKEFIISYFNPGQSNVDGIVPGCNYHLELTPLSAITDEDHNVIIQNKIMNPHLPKGDVELDGRIGGIHLSDITTCDYLRSKGYALPWMGLSVEQQIEFGWVKLKES